MAKTVLAALVAVTALALLPGWAQAQIYRYNPQTGQSENISAPVPAAPSPATGATGTKSRGLSVGRAPRPAPASAAGVASQIKNAIKAEQAQEKPSAEGASTRDLIAAVNKAIADEQSGGREMLPLGRVGIILHPEEYNATIERNAAELNAIPDLDKVFMTPPVLMPSLLFLMEWPKLAEVEFMIDDNNLVQKKYGIKKIPGFVYLRPDGSYNAYSLDDLAPFYDALAQQRRKVAQ